MLCITLLPGDYFTVGSDIVIQFDRLSGERIHLVINAPREVNTAQNLRDMGLAQFYSQNKETSAA